MPLPRTTKIYHCGHCNQLLSRSALWKHRTKYYNSSTQEWDKTAAARDQRKCHNNQNKPTNHGTNGRDNGVLWSESSSEEDEMEFLQSKVGNTDENSSNASSIDQLEFHEDDMHDETTIDRSQENYENPTDNSDAMSSHDEEEPEIWNDDGDVSDIMQDIDADDVPLPEPKMKQSKCKAITSLLRWFVYFLLIWQTTCKISDNGIEWLLRFQFQFFHSLGLCCDNEYLVEVALMFPSSLYLLRQFVNLDRDDFKKYAVCPKCLKLYGLDECTVRIGDRIEANTCMNKPFAAGRQKECGTVLARKFVTGSNKHVFYPHKVYCCKSIINQLECILKRPGIPELCERWRNRNVDNEAAMADIYDGDVWKDFQAYEGQEFLSSKNNIALAMNVDWFQPYKHRKDRSVGAIYLVILNLPREERYKWENVIIAGIIPELQKEPKSLNSFLNPIVDELKRLWTGIRLYNSASCVPFLHRAALLLASSDIPASRKLCGFKGHSAHRGCSKCFKFFPSSFSEKTDYSGFDVQNWPKRDIKTHRKQATEVQNAPNVTQYENMAKKYGLYYSSLLKLEYFDVIRMTAIDPMHNLFLGTSKRFFKLLVSEEVLGKKELNTLEERLKSIDMPTGYGRLPKNIISNYGSYTASQWKNWTLIYSVYCLNGLIPDKYFRCWQTYVLACQYISKAVITKEDIDRAHGLFVKFCQQFEKVFGKQYVTPNMHLHCHLKGCVQDYGPVHTFWCFAFERFNGILGSTPTNGRSIEVQLMRKLLIGNFAYNTTLPTEYKETFLPFFQQNMDILDGCNEKNALYFSKSAGCHNLQQVDWSDLSLLSFPKSYQHMAIDSDDLSLLLSCYRMLYPSLEGLNFNSLSRIARRYAFIFLGKEKFGSQKESRSLRSSRVMASWAGDEGSIKLSSSIRPGQVKFHFIHSLTVNNTTKQHVFSCVQWYKSDNDIHHFGNPSQVWRLKEFVKPGPSIFMPVQRISQTFAACVIKRNDIDKLVVSPIQRLFH